MELPTLPLSYKAQACSGSLGKSSPPDGRDALSFKAEPQPPQCRLRGRRVWLRPVARTLHTCLQITTLSAIALSLPSAAWWTCQAWWSRSSWQMPYSMHWCLGSYIGVRGSVTHLHTSLHCVVASQSLLQHCLCLCVCGITRHLYTNLSDPFTLHYIILIPYSYTTHIYIHNSDSPQNLVTSKGSLLLPRLLCHFDQFGSNA